MRFSRSLPHLPRLRVAGAGVAFLLVLTAPFASAEIRRFDGPIDAASNYVHFSEGYIVAPGYVDVSGLTFRASGDDGSDQRDYSGLNKGPYVEEVDFDDDGFNNDDGVDDGNRLLAEEKEGEKAADDEIATEAAEETAGSEATAMSTFIDMVFFREPETCANTRAGCDWTELGVGASDGSGNLRWCCSDDAASLGLCRGGPREDGRLIIDSARFDGVHRMFAVPPSGDWNYKPPQAQFHLKTRGRKHSEQNRTKFGKYVLIISNCNDVVGRNVTVSGEYVWKSAHGYLPGNLFGEMHFFFVLTILYVILFLWYGSMMAKHSEASIPIQKWMFCTIGVGLLEVFFKAGDLWVWNEDGVRFWFSLYTGVLFGVCKRAVSRCLVLMVSMGWGVTRDTLGFELKRVVILGVVYAVVSALRDITTVLAITENQILTDREENGLLDVVTILAFVAAFVDLIFYLWIFDALNGTMQYLEGMSQTSKLARFLRLRCILLLSVLFAVVWTVFGIVDSYNDQRMLAEEQNGWVLSAVWEVNYLLVLIGLSVLWRPEPNAKEYAYVMELPALGGDMEFDTSMVDGPDSDEDDQIVEYIDENGMKVDEGVTA